MAISIVPTLWVSCNDAWRGRGAFSTHRSAMATDRGELRREDADMSNDKTGEIPVRRKPKVSWATFFVPGLAGT